MAILHLKIPGTDTPIDLDCNNDRFFFAWQALNSQAWLAVDDRQRERTEYDDENAYQMRRMAMREWSIAVRHGFVDC